MPKKLLVLLLCAMPAMVWSQSADLLIDSLNRKLATLKSAKERVEILGDISRLYMNVNLQASDSVGALAVAEAEKSRNRQLMADALLVNGERNSYFATRKENLTKAIDFYNRALELSKENKLNSEAARSYLALSSIYRAIPDADKAFGFVTRANSYIDALQDDSLAVIAQLETGNIYNLKREKLLALKAYLHALSLAENENKNNPDLLHGCYTALTNFYSSIKKYDKAIDYAMAAYDILDKINKGNTPYAKTAALSGIGNLYSQKRSYDVANNFFQQALRRADSLHYEPLKIPAYMGILNNHLNAGRPEAALQFINNNQEVKDFAQRFGLSQQISYAYGYIYTDLGKYDSAKFYYAKAAPFYENSSTETSKYVFYFQIARTYRLSGENAKAIDNLLKAKGVAEKIGDPERIKLAAKELDTIYQYTGDYKQSRFYNMMYYQYKDSIEALGRENDLISEAEDAEKQRKKRLAEEEEANRKRRNNIQYTAIAMGIVVLLIFLVVMGMFRVSAGFIKALGFFVFLMLFEFIFLVFKKNIYSMTHGEPWKDLAFMIGLAALLVPLHHWVEHKVLHYLTSHNRLTQAGHHIKNKIFRRNKE